MTDERPTASSLPSVLAPDWRVHEQGRVTHLILNGLAACGETGTRWRAVAGMTRCPVCKPTTRNDTTSSAA